MILIYYEKQKLALLDTCLMGTNTKVGENRPCSFQGPQVFIYSNVHVVFCAMALIQHLEGSICVWFCIVFFMETGWDTDWDTGTETG